MKFSQIWSKFVFAIQNPLRNFSKRNHQNESTQSRVILCLQMEGTAERLLELA